MIPLWLPWVILFAVTLAVLPGKDAEWRRTRALPGFLLVVAIWVTVDHVWVSQDELTEATEDAAAAVDGRIAGVSETRLALEIEERVGHAVTIEATDSDSDSDSDAIDDTVSSAYVVKLDGGGDHPVACVKVVERRVDRMSALRVASVSATSGACD